MIGILRVTTFFFLFFASVFWIYIPQLQRIAPHSYPSTEVKVCPDTQHSWSPQMEAASPRTASAPFSGGLPTCKPSPSSLPSLLYFHSGGVSTAIMVVCSLRSPLTKNHCVLLEWLLLQGLFPELNIQFSIDLCGRFALFILN